jgi:hypothetical protein
MLRANASGQEECVGTSALQNLVDRQRAAVESTVAVGDRETARSRTEHAVIPLAP